jgi:hypothetical protein
MAFFITRQFDAIRLPNISRRESTVAAMINNMENYLPSDRRNSRSMPTRLLGSTTLLNQDGERLANSMIEPFSLRVAGYLVVH